MELREALRVNLVNDRVVPGRPWRPVALPVEGGVDDEALRDRRGVVFAVGLEIGVLSVPRVGMDVGRAPVDGALDRLRVRVDEELGRVEALALERRVGPMDAVGVALAGPDPGEVAVPVERRPLRQRDAGLDPDGVEEAELDPLRVLGKEREVRPFTVPRGAEREGPPGPRPQRGQRTTPVQGGTSSNARSEKFMTSVALPRLTVSTRASSSTSASTGASGRRRRSSRSAR
jgi:hypothetical protein